MTADAALGRAELPAPAAARRVRMRVDDGLVVDALAALVAADTSSDVAHAPLPRLLEVEGVRAAAVVTRDGARVVVVGSAGYDCGVMAPGAVLPLDAGLPVTEAVRTGRPVAQGAGPGWIALPFRTPRLQGALLLSLELAPPEALPELWRLQRVARAIGDALQRAVAHQRSVAALATVSGQLVARPTTATCWDVVTRSLPHDGVVGGDVLLCLPDGRDGQWLVAADVCGCGLPAAVVARTVQAAVAAVAAYVDDPAELLAVADRAVRATAGTRSFVTAVAVHALGRTLTVASAGHPVPVLLTAAGARQVEVEPGLPLALEGAEAGLRATASVQLPADAVLLLHTDGLLDRRTPDDGPVSADVLTLVQDRPLHDLDALADELLERADAVGGAGDDVSLLLARPVG